MIEGFQRDLLRGSLDMMILSALARGAQYGYGVQKQIELASQGRVKIAAGTLYPILHRLESDKLIKSRWEDDTGRKRKWYELTATGKKRLQKQAEEWTQFAHCLQTLLAPVVGGGKLATSPAT
jgi:PadR family transcriptional regulator, regulatory protein PadR